MVSKPILPLVIDSVGLFHLGFHNHIEIVGRIEKAAIPLILSAEFNLYGAFQRPQHLNIFQCYGKDL